MAIHDPFNGFQGLSRRRQAGTTIAFDYGRDYEVGVPSNCDGFRHRSSGCHPVVLLHRDGAGRVPFLDLSLRPVLNAVQDIFFRNEIEKKFKDKFSLLGFSKNLGTQVEQYGDLPNLPVGCHKGF